MKNIIYVNGEYEKLNISTDLIINFIQQILLKLKLENKELSLYFCEKDEIKNYNEKYRGIKKPTDVLSFSQLDGEQEGFDNNILGDIVICTDILIQQAGDYNVSYKKELLRLLIHSILHLIGYDHETNKKDEEIMRKKESDLMEYMEGKVD